MGKFSTIVKSIFPRRALLLISLITGLLQACSNNSNQTPAIEGTRSGDSFLYVSPEDFYFGTRDVGTTTTQRLQIANRGADTYELSSMRVAGNLEEEEPDDRQYSPEEFSSDITDAIILQPADAVSVNVSFKPITEQQKKANFVVSYNTIKRESDSANALEQRYYEGFDDEKDGNYQAAKAAYQDYVLADPVTVNKRKASIKLPIIEESDTFGQGTDLTLYLRAIDLRDRGEQQQAIEQLEGIVERYSDSYLADDSLYLIGYIQLQDLRNSADALRTMQTLRKRYPDSTYYDTSLYSEALAQISLGNETLAREILTDLRNRHTGLKVLGVAFAKDEIMSRLWFDRASQTLSQL